MLNGDRTWPTDATPPLWKFAWTRVGARREDLLMPKVHIELLPSVVIDPIPTGADGMVRGSTITVMGSADCDVTRTMQGHFPDSDDGDGIQTTSNEPEHITEVAVQFGPSAAFVPANPVPGSVPA